MKILKFKLVSLLFAITMMSSCSTESVESVDENVQNSEVVLEKGPGVQAVTWRVFKDGELIRTGQGDNNYTSDPNRVVFRNISSAPKSVVVKVLFRASQVTAFLPIKLPSSQDVVYIVPKNESAVLMAHKTFNTATPPNSF